MIKRVFGQNVELFLPAFCARGTFTRCKACSFGRLQWSVSFVHQHTHTRRHTHWIQPPGWIFWTCLSSLSSIFFIASIPFLISITCFPSAGWKHSPSPWQCHASSLSLHLLFPPLELVQADPDFSIQKEEEEGSCSVALRILTSGNHLLSFSLPSSHPLSLPLRCNVNSPVIILPLQACRTGWCVCQGGTE